MKYIDILGRKGCSRTALEICKLLFSLDPLDDPYGALLRIDYYAVRARETDYIRKLIKALPNEVYPDDCSPLDTFLIFPNLLLTMGLTGERESNKAEVSLKFLQNM